jgi:hypothetical protein
VTFYLSVFFGTSTSKLAIGLFEVLIKSQTLIPFSVPTATHYNFGLKAIVLMVDPASKFLDGWVKSRISQMNNFLSLPPVAIYFPLMEMETKLTLP